MQKPNEKRPCFHKELRITEERGGWEGTTGHKYTWPSTTVFKRLSAGAGKIFRREETEEKERAGTGQMIRKGNKGFYDHNQPKKNPGGGEEKIH